MPGVFFQNRRFSSTQRGVLCRCRSTFFKNDGCHLHKGGSYVDAGQIYIRFFGTARALCRYVTEFSNVICFCGFLPFFHDAFETALADGNISSRKAKCFCPMSFFSAGFAVGEGSSPWNNQSRSWSSLYFKRLRATEQPGWR